MAEQPQQQKKEEAQEPTYARERLLSYSQEYVGVPEHVLAGALSQADGRKSSFTISEAKSAVKEWGKVKIDLDPQAEEN
jgi:hypothetical protein